jgi:hypothetical protein
MSTILADLPMFPSATVPPPPRQVAAAATRPVGALPAFITGGLYRRYLKPGEIVVVVSQRGNAGMLFQADTGFYFRIAGGYINMSLSQQDPPPVAALTHLTRDTVRQFQDYVRDAGVGRHPHRAGLGSTVDERLQPDGHARHIGGRRNRLPHRLPGRRGPGD